ncbi:MAG: aminotransferase class IV [Candidatus Marinimicrobia bacterium]|nr:aminotransferase class IV [Candidatus Neomarinimicrobiota bacterium]|tara:strand:+ start:10340 stop:11257 length:918 start_codon:yes stop_codon:yes gene_type:complete
MRRGTHQYLEDSRNENVMIYINGEIISRPEAKISVFDSGFLLGDGVWEGIRLHNGKMVFLDKHLNRLYKGAEELAITIGKTKDELKNLLDETILANSMNDNVHIRLIVSRGLKKTPYQHPNANVGGATIVIIPEYKIVNKEVLKHGIRLGTVSIQRGTKFNQNPQLNTLSKLNCIAACIEADQLGFDEGLMLDIKGNVATCNSTNFFIVKGEEVWTSTGEYCLPGVTRDNIISLCRENSIDIYEKEFLVESVHNSDEAFVTGTFAGVIPVIEVDGYKISGGKRGKITNCLQNLYSDLISTECENE